LVAAVQGHEKWNRPSGGYMRRHENSIM
jgi:hypothetical protein